MVWGWFATDRANVGIILSRDIGVSVKKNIKIKILRMVLVNNNNKTLPPRSSGDMTYYEA